jgi:hypothetical protein
VSVARHPAHKNDQQSWPSVPVTVSGHNLPSRILPFSPSKPGYVYLGVNGTHSFPCKENGGKGQSLNGTYKRSNLTINGQPHFVKEVNRSGGGGGGRVGIGSRRHLFMGPEKCWVIATRCDESEGLLAQCTSGNPFSNGEQEFEFKTFGDLGKRGDGEGDAGGGGGGGIDVATAAAAVTAADVGFSPGFTVVDSTALGGPLLQVLETELTVSLFSAAEAFELFGMGEDDSYGSTAAAAAAAAASTGAGAAADAGTTYLGDLLPWESGNHDCLVVSRVGQGRGGLRLLGLHQAQRSNLNQLHPDLKALLELHGVPLDMTLTNINNNHSLGSGSAADADAVGVCLASLLSEITDVTHDAKQAQRLTG